MFFIIYNSDSMLSIDIIIYILDKIVTLINSKSNNNNNNKNSNII